MKISTFAIGGLSRYQINSKLMETFEVVESKTNTFKTNRLTDVQGSVLYTYKVNCNFCNIPELT